MKDSLHRQDYFDDRFSSFTFFSNHFNSSVCTFFIWEAFEDRVFKHFTLSANCCTFLTREQSSFSVGLKVGVSFSFTCLIFESKGLLPSLLTCKNQALIVSSSVGTCATILETFVIPPPQPRILPCHYGFTVMAFALSLELGYGQPLSATSTAMLTVDCLSSQLAAVVENNWDDRAGCRLLNSYINSYPAAGC